MVGKTFYMILFLKIQCSDKICSEYNLFNFYEIFITQTSFAFFFHWFFLDALCFILFPCFLVVEKIKIFLKTQNEKTEKLGI